MGFRITTWNVNGIRNPFSYEPWRGKRTFEAMFDILEADIVIFQETKIQRKDLRDDMVLVPGWDCYFSLPRNKKGYSGVVIYTRNATCAPIRAEEGLTGTLCPPNSSIAFRDLPEEQQIGGYPTLEQLSRLELDAATLDSEGRCVVLEFPAFVVIGVYCPANRDETRDAFRLNFLDLLDARIRNLVAMGKRVFVAGDLNIARGEIDAAHAGEAIRKGSTTEDEFISTPSRRLFNQLLDGGRVIGDRDEGRTQPVLFDICRSFHPERKGMYTCWEQRINARPGNYGARIDYVLCSLGMKDWFCDSNIQEGLMGSDHCPVYATIKDFVTIDGAQISIRDITNPSGVFQNGQRQLEYSTKYLLPLSGRLITEFDRRRSIKDMFSTKPVSPLKKTTSSLTQGAMSTVRDAESSVISNMPTIDKSTTSAPDWNGSTASRGVTRKRSEKTVGPSIASAKRSKSVAGVAAGAAAPGQQTLKGFFKSKTGLKKDNTNQIMADDIAGGLSADPLSRASGPSMNGHSNSQMVSDASTPKLDNPAVEEAAKPNDSPNRSRPGDTTDNETFVDPIVSKEDWTKLFTKKPIPRCEGHQEPCISLTTKKPGINCGRSFWICPRPLGPSGEKEKGTQWRCPTFIWASDRNSSGQ